MPRFVHRPAPRGVAILTALAGTAALGAVFVLEYWDELVPCALCLVERWPYRIVIGLGLVAAIAPRGLSRFLLWLALLCLLASVGLGALHVGVEQGWWPSPLPECAAPHITGQSIAERLAQMPARPSKPCDAPTFLIPSIPVSIAGMNAIYALVVGFWLAMVLTASSPRRR